MNLEDAYMDIFSNHFSVLSVNEIDIENQNIEPSV